MVFFPGGFLGCLRRFGASCCASNDSSRLQVVEDTYIFLDIPEILLEAQNRWLRPTEICQILYNYKKFSIAPEPPNRPPSGSLFLFDRKILRYFRKDGHIWRKKKDGKTVKEAHEKLKVGSVDVLHCYYAHGEENENFQRRTYWLLEEGFMNIVLVHYLDIKGGKQSFSRSKEAEEIARLSTDDSPACSNSFASQSQVASQTMDAESPISGQISEYEDAETDNNRASSRYHPFVEMQQPVDGVMMDNLLGSPAPSTCVNNLGYQGELQAATTDLNNHYVTRHGIANVFNEAGAGLRSGSKSPLDSVHFREAFPEYSTGLMEPTLHSSVATMGSNNLDDNSRLETFMTEELYTNNLTQREADALSAAGMTSSQVQSENYADGSIGYPLLKQSSLDLFKIEPNGLKKFDSFTRWMSDELAEVADLGIKSSSDAFWSSTETVNAADGSSIPINEQLEQLNAYVVSPSLSQDQLFSIIDVSPSWAYSVSEIKVLITGTFLTNKENVENCKWSCMFGDVEVPAEVLADGSLRCYTPVHQSGRVPFYVTCSNRVACSEVREFEFCDSETQYMEADPHTTGINDMHLRIRLDKLLSLGPDDYEKYVLSDGNDKHELVSTIGALMLDDKFTNLALPSDEKDFSAAQDKNLEKLVKDKLYCWLIHKIHDDGKGPNVLGKEGQGVIHLVAALGYDWAIRPIITAGVPVNFRDARGWTALHWAASCGRERTVGSLITNGAASGALTDPTPQFPSGRTPADLASENGHKGIAGFLAESALTSHLSALTLKESQGCNVEKICELSEANGFAEPSSAQLTCQDSEAESLKDSLSAVRKSTQAAARIFQAFRVESFHRKKVVEYGDDDCGLSDERTLSLISLKNAKSGQNDMPHSAAVRIQNKFRGWKGRKEFMIIRQKIIKIQAHVRGHQVRRNYRKVVWSVGIVEKVILRWRRKGRGLRGFQPDKQLEGPSQIEPAKDEDEYDFLKDGRKQAEGRLQRSLARVKSMTNYPEAREQYSRLQACVTELQDTKEKQDKMLIEAAGADGGDFMVDLEDLCGDDDGHTPMPTIL
ncbi:calmodulin-binding transcription activator 3 isoform X2 [Brachypodium distachyon]|uniref:calmodulin-binding transcription activator 3 isoform X2 n=1 Tax=Brachypodium distachyon TaxID=15368 RepID=UPI000D0DD23F|nr:calmodulin-binding transcription activator 3 isoform X2 [Brachypodium distachyon]|eukprot:XP_024313805.1 calmodulin-binding transcription activator 3 isoform X2 [Brachypodium distachyon]